MKLGKVRALERGDQQNRSQTKRHLTMLTQWLSKIEASFEFDLRLHSLHTRGSLILVSGAVL